MSKLTFVINLDSPSALTAAQFTQELGRLCAGRGASFAIESASDSTTLQVEPDTAAQISATAVGEQDSAVKRVATHADAEIETEVRPVVVNSAEASSLAMADQDNHGCSQEPTDLPGLEVESKHAQWVRERGRLRSHLESALKGQASEGFLAAIENGQIPDGLDAKTTKLATNLRGIAAKLRTATSEASTQPATARADERVEVAAPEIPDEWSVEDLYSELQAALNEQAMDASRVALVIGSLRAGKQIGCLDDPWALALAAEILRCQKPTNQH